MIRRGKPSISPKKSAPSWQPTWKHTFAGLLGLISMTSGALYLTRETWIGPAGAIFGWKPDIVKEDISVAIGEKGAVGELPKNLTLDLKGRRYPVSVEYATHPELTAEMSKLIGQYKPDYSAFVALDATTGRILTLLSYSADDALHGQNLALRATFPSASVFKVVTAAAAISERKMNSGSIVSYNGRAHTLYRRNIFKDERNRWTVHMTLKDAFARSINSVFGKLGVFIVGPSELKSYAERFGFNRKLASDIPVQEGRAEISEDPWEIAEAASGYTRQNTMSPLQGALIAAAIANEGKLMEPYIVSTLKNEKGEIVFTGGPRLSQTVINAEAAAEMKILMGETVSSGTSRGAFRGFKKGQFGNVEVGGKTGSLTGNDPEGKYDWFVGYGIAGEHRLAIASLVISKEYWKVKSSFLARKAIEHYFRPNHGNIPIALDRRVASSKKSVAYSTRGKRKRHRRK